MIRSERMAALVILKDLPRGIEPNRYWTANSV